MDWTRKVIDKHERNKDRENVTKQGCVNFRNIQNVYLQSSVECLIDVWKGHEYTFSFKLFLLISYDPLEVNTFPSLVIHRQNHGGYKYVVLNLNHIQDEWMFNDTPARKADRLLGVRKR